jgi:hypothetical protein
LAESNLANRLATLYAGFALSVVDSQFIAEIAGFPITVIEIT